MSSGNVTSKPLAVLLDLFPATQNEGATSNSQYKQSSLTLEDFAKKIPGPDGEALQRLAMQLAPPLGELFNSAWKPARSAAQDAAAKLFATKAATDGLQAWDVTCSLAPLGTVTAETFVKSDGTPFLILSFNLPGGFFHFGSLTAGANWKITFDAILSITTPVPVKPFDFKPSVQLTLSNAQLWPDNFASEFDASASTLVTMFANAFSSSPNGSNWVSSFDWNELVVAQHVDGSQKLGALSSATDQLVGLFAEMNKQTGNCAKFGFTRRGFSVMDGQLTLTITHDLDRAPNLVDVDHPAVKVLVPSLSCSASQAIPGQSIKLKGYDFPVDTSTQINLQWNNTASGTLSVPSLTPKAELRVDNQITPVSNLNLTTNTNTKIGTYSFTATSLSPGKSYKLAARCGDILTWSKWSETLEVNTLANNAVDVSLASLLPGSKQPPFDLGKQALSKTSGNFSFSAQIPSQAAPGPYAISVKLQGKVLCTTPIAIVASLAPVIEVIEPSTGIVIHPPIFGGTLFTIRGEGFPDGQVTIAISGEAAATATAKNGRFEVALHAPGNQWTIGVYPLTATLGTVTATLAPPLKLVGAPQ